MKAVSNLGVTADPCWSGSMLSKTVATCQCGYLHLNFFKLNKIKSSTLQLHKLYCKCSITTVVGGCHARQKDTEHFPHLRKFYWTALNSNFFF